MVKSLNRDIRAWRLAPLRPIGLQALEFVLRQSRLLEDAAEGARRHVSCVHGDVGLPPIWMAEHDVRAGLTAYLEPGALEAGQDFTRLVGHRREFPRWRRSTRKQAERFRRWLSFRRSRVG